MTLRDFGRIWRREGTRDGRPCLSETGIPVDAVSDRFVAGESIHDLADDYAVEPATIEAALRLVLYARGTNLETRRAATKIDQVVPLLMGRQ